MSLLFHCMNTSNRYTRLLSFLLFSSPPCCLLGCDPGKTLHRICFGQMQSQSNIDSRSGIVSYHAGWYFRQYVTRVCSPSNIAFWLGRNALSGTKRCEELGELFTSQNNGHAFRSGKVLYKWERVSSYRLHVFTLIFALLSRLH